MTWINTNEKLPPNEQIVAISDGFHVSKAFRVNGTWVDMYKVQLWFSPSHWCEFPEMTNVVFREKLTVFEGLSKTATFKDEDEMV